MTLLFRFALLAMLTGFMTGCETLYIDQSAQPAPTQVYYNTQPQPVRVPPVVYPTQPQSGQVPVPIQTPPLPPSVPSKAPVRVMPSPAVNRAPVAVMPVQTIGDDGFSNSNVIPARAPGSISELPDPS